MRRPATPSRKPRTRSPARRPGRAEDPRAAAARRCRREFLRHFPGGFRDPTYLDWERNYKWEAHRRFLEALDRDGFRRRLATGDHRAIADHAVRVESRTNLLFSFEKMALRDAVRTPAGARRFAEGLDALLHGRGGLEDRFEAWCEAVAGLPRRQTRVLTWPLVTVFGFLAQPETHLFLKPMVTRRAAEAYAFDFRYASRPAWPTYASYLELGELVRRDLRDLRPRDQIDVQSFLWVLGSDEY